MMLDNAFLKLRCTMSLLLLEPSHFPITDLIKHKLLTLAFQSLHNIAPPPLPALFHTSTNMFAYCSSKMVCAYGPMPFTHALTSVGGSSSTIFPLKKLTLFSRPIWNTTTLTNHFMFDPTECRHFLL